MPLLDTLASTVLESVIAGVALGMALVMAIAIVLRMLAPLNAATRAMVWTAALAALPIIPVVYFFSHAALSSPAPAIAATYKPAIVPQSADLSVASAHSIQTDSTKTTPTPPASRKFEVSVSRDFPTAALAIYAVVVALLLFRLLISYLRLCLLRRRTQPAPEELAARLSHWLARCPTHRTVELRLSQTARSPLAIGWLRPIIVMPAALVLELSQQDLDNLGVHELAHIRRYDDWTNLLQRLLQSLFFFHPAVHYVARKLNLEREFACDDWVVTAQASKSYARCLTKVVELRRYHRGAFLLSSGAFFGKRQLLKRVEALLDKTRNSATRISSLTVVVTVIMLAAIVTEIMHLPSVVALTQEDGSTSSMRWSDGSKDFRINTRGEVTFSPDEQSIATVSPGGFLSIDESKGWSHRRLEVRPGPGGAPEEKYFLDGREKQMDGVGRAWAASAYLFMLREMGIDAEGRVSRILARRGAVGVLEEVDLIHSDNVKRQYLTFLMDQSTLTPADLQRVADCARKISSDNDKAEFLLAHQREFITGDLRNSYFRAVNSISSDDDRRRVLTGILETDGQSPETARLVGLSAKTMSSDNDKAEVLLSIPNANGDTHCALLKAARTIQSDDDKARVLHESGYIESTQCRDDFFAVVNLIESDNDRSNVLQNLLKQPNLTPETYHEIANSVRTMSSDNDKANVLTILGAQYAEAPFFEATNTIDSSNDRERVLQAALAQTPTQTVLLQVIESASTISGDNEKANVLLAVAKQSHESEVRAALQQACGKLNSDNDYRRVASAIFESDLPKKPGI
jgi:beta-lactamase regulating signal transducer with metallopeptidase domain